MADATVPPKRRPGRPRLDADDQSVKLSITLTASGFDHLCHDAKRNNLTLAEQARRRLQPPPHLKPTD